MRRELIEIDMVDAQAIEAARDRIHDMSAGRAATLAGAGAVFGKPGADGPGADLGDGAEVFIGGAGGFAVTGLRSRSSEPAPCPCRPVLQGRICGI